MNCPNCGIELKENQKFCTKCGTKIDFVPESQEHKQNEQNTFNIRNLFIGISLFVGFLIIVILIFIIYLSKYNDLAIDNDIQEQTEHVNQLETTNIIQKTENEKQVETTNIIPKTPADKLNLINEYQAKYFKIIRRNDVLLAMELDSDFQKDMDELDDLFNEVKEKISNNYYLSKYNEIEDRYSENPGESTLDMNIFASQHYDEVDELLNEVYQAAKAEISQQDFKNLAASEIKWLKDVESYKSVFDSKGFGSIGTLVNLNYEIHMKNFRTLLLMLYL